MSSSDDAFCCVLRFNVEVNVNVEISQNLDLIMCSIVSVNIESASTFFIFFMTLYVTFCLCLY
jgi:hypothetical protein